MAAASTPTADVLAAYFQTPVTLSAIEAGNINDTFKVETSGGRFVLQRVNPIFSPHVNEDIAALTPYVKRAGLCTPEIVPTRSRALWHRAPDGGIWRVLTFVDGHTHLNATGPAMCRAAGQFLARFHAAFKEISYSFVATRLGVHDTDAHLQGLKEAIAQHPEHKAAREVRDLAQTVFAAMESIAPMPALPKRIVHGDPKLANFLFRNDREVSALVDLDTLCEMEVALELGDALRSWSNSGPGGGEGQFPVFEPSLFSASVEGYAEGARGYLTGDETSLLADATLRISLELAARFLRDALEERYFSWNQKRFAHAFEHHLERARSQIGFAVSLEKQLEWARRTVQAALPPTAALADPAKSASPRTSERR